MEQEREPLIEGSRGNGLKDNKDEKDSALAAVDLRFAIRMSRLLRIAKCEDCVWLVLLSIISVAITSQAGLVVGHFYNALLSKNLKLFAGTIWQCLLWYGGESVCNATQLWAAEYLAIGWRLNLTEAAHSAYCSRPSISALSQGHSLDNPDERLTNEVSSFCQSLAELMMKTIASPLMILYYTWWVWYHVGWIGPVVIYTFFFFGVTVTRLIISPIAGLVARQEKLEADFRISHVRFHTNAEEIGMYDSLECERRKLEKDLKAALENRKKLVSRHFVLKLSNKAYDYLGGILTYCVIAIPVFGGLFDTEDSGELANLISNASFAVLQLIYGFSELMDSANLVSDVAGHCARIGELFEFLDVLPQIEKASKEDLVGLKTKQDDERSEFYFGTAGENVFQSGQNIASTTVGRLSHNISLGSSLADERGGQEEVFAEIISRVVQRLARLGHWAGAINIDTGVVVYRSELFETDEEQGLRREEVSPLNPTYRSLSQRRGHEVGHKRSAQGGVEEQNQIGSRQSLTQSIRIIDADVDTSEVYLDYSDRTVCAISSAQQSGPVVHQPDVVSVFTSAPVAVLQRVIKACVHEVAASFEEQYVASEAESQIQSFCSLLPALVVNHMTVFAPWSKKPVVRDLTMELHWGESLLIMGPSGSGKTSLLRTLCDLWPLEAGSKRIPPISNCKSSIILPQLPLMAKAGLAGQIVYPEAPLVGSSLSYIVPQLQQALESVGMESLLTRVHNNWELESDWADTLSPGEQQLLSLARVFYHRPQLVILDEATSALTEQSEDAIYGRLLELGVTVISVAHRSRLRCYHSKLLEIFGDGKGGWSLS